MTGVVNIAINGNTGSIDRALGKTDKKVNKIVGSFNDMGKSSKKVGWYRNGTKSYHKKCQIVFFV